MTPRSLVLAVALLAAACGSNVDSDNAASTTTSPPTTAPPTTAPSTTAPPTTLPLETSSTETTVAEETVTEPSSTTPVVDVVRVSEMVSVDCSIVGRVQVGLQTGTITSGGVEYRYQWTVPSTYDGSPIPVVLDFHGIGSNGAQQAVFSGFAALAEAEGFLAVQPTGISVGRDDRASWELPQFESAQRDDISMVVDLLDHVAANVCIDPTRIYATGMSNGALFTSTLVCELGNTIAAAVSVAGVTHDESCEPTRPMPYLAFHGTADTTIPFRGGGETTLSGSDGGEFFEQVMPDEFAEFAADFGCAASNDVVVSDAVTLTSWEGCTNDVEVGFYTIDGGGHTWPGSMVSSAITSLGVTNMDIDATALAWEFFQRHQL